MRFDVSFASLGNGFSFDMGTIEDKFNLDMGTITEIVEKDHDRLQNRDLPDQHPIGSIMGLQDILDTIPQVRYDTTENWNAFPSFVPERGAIIAYSDYAVVDDKEIPNIKIGDGSTYLIDLPFVGEDMYNAVVSHLTNFYAHVSATDREGWNNKVRCYVSPSDGGDHLLIFTTD